MICEGWRCNINAGPPQTLVIWADFTANPQCTPSFVNYYLNGVPIGSIQAGNGGPMYFFRGPACVGPILWSNPTTPGNSAYITVPGLTYGNVTANTPIIGMCNGNC